LFEPATVVPLGSLPALNATYRSAALVYAPEGAEVSVSVYNGHWGPVEVSVYVGGASDRRVVAPGASAVFGPYRVAATGVVELAVEVRALEGGSEPNLNVRASASVAGGDVLQIVLVYWTVLFLAVAPTVVALERLLSRRGLWLALQPSLLLAASAGLIVAASRVAEGAELAYARVEPLGDPCPLDPVVVHFYRIRGDYSMAVLGVFAGALAVPASPDYSLQYYASVNAAYAARRLLAGVAAVHAVFTVASLAVATAAGVALGGLDLAVRLWPLPLNDLCNVAPLAVGLAASAGLAVYAPAMLALALRRPLTVALATTLALTVVGGRVVSLSYAGCCDELNFVVGGAGRVLAALALVGVVAAWLAWRRR